MFSSEDEYWDSDSFDSDDAKEFLQKVEREERINKLMLEQSQKLFVKKIVGDMMEFEKTLDRIEQKMDDVIDHANTKIEFMIKMNWCVKLANRNYNTITRMFNGTNKKGVNTNEFKSVLSQMTHESCKVLETLEKIVAKMEN